MGLLRRDMGFYVVSPDQQIQSGLFEDLVMKERIRSQVKARVDQYKGAHDSWFEDTFLPTLDAISLDLLSWESIIDHIEKHNAGTGIRQFFRNCLSYNPMRGKPARDGRNSDPIGGGAAALGKGVWRSGV